MRITESGIRMRTASKQDIVISLEQDEEYIPAPVRRLALRIWKNRDLMEEILNVLRASYQAKKETFHISLAHLSKEDQETVISIFEDMTGMVSMVHGSYRGISGKLVMTPKAVSFIGGMYLEIAVFERTREIVRGIAFRRGLDYRVCRNGIVTMKSGRSKNEFDVVIILGEKLYVLEVKSGRNCDYDKYVKIGQEYGIVPGRFLLVDTYLSEEQASSIEYFCDYCVTNMDGNTFADKLTAMLEADLA